MWHLQLKLLQLQTRKVNSQKVKSVFTKSAKKEPAKIDHQAVYIVYVLCCVVLTSVQRGWPL